MVKELRVIRQRSRTAQVFAVLAVSALLITACGDYNKGYNEGMRDALSIRAAMSGGQGAVAPGAQVPGAEQGSVPGAASAGDYGSAGGLGSTGSSSDGASASGDTGSSAGSSGGTAGSSAGSAGGTEAADASGAAQQGITDSEIKLGMINMHGMAMGNVLADPQARGMEATAAAINDQGGIHGRKITMVNCDDGPGEASRTKACVRKLHDQDKIFALSTVLSWGSAAIHSDLKRMKLPLIGAWAYSYTEWLNPWMFPTHMSMLNEAKANAHWAAKQINPDTYGLVCLTSPDMQQSCDNVEKILTGKYGKEMVERADVDLNERSMSGPVLAMRNANPDHIIHYVINPATMVKFMNEAAQQQYYPPKGISGNHLATEVLGDFFGQWPAGRYWTNTTYKLWGTEFMATMNKYTGGNDGENHHIVQAGYVGVNIFAEAMKKVGPNPTREKLVNVFNSKAWYADKSLDQSFLWSGNGREGMNEHGNRREFMYFYESTNTKSNPNGTPNGFKPAEQFEIWAKDA